MFHPHYVTLKNGKAALIRYVEPADSRALIDHVNEVGAERVYISTERVAKSVDEEAEEIRRFDREFVLFLVAIIDGRLVGSSDVQKGRQTKRAHTGSFGIAIRKEARGIGLGRAMMEDSIRWARSVGIRKLSLTVFATNESAVALYRALGFVEEARLKDQVILDGQSVDELVMARWM
ncbi:MAG TPA: GNAT family N-acetyltransferase [Thermoplasmata archaeon]|nr:GNAT family N-acetyltransferase [Thermoplasmata archaeon]